MTHGIFSRPGVVDGIDTYGRPVELPDPDGTGFPDTMPNDSRARFLPAPMTGRDTCTGRCETAAGCDCWPGYVSATPMREPHPWRETVNVWPVLGLALLALSAVAVVALFAAAWPA